VGGVGIFDVEVEERGHRRTDTGAADEHERVADAHLRGTVAVKVAGRVEGAPQEVDEDGLVLHDEAWRDVVVPVRLPCAHGTRLRHMEA
jgi:hypothetical protein